MRQVYRIVNGSPTAFFHKRTRLSCRDMDNTLIENLKRRLEETGKSAREVSLAATGTPDTVRNILRGATRDPKADVLARIAVELSTTPEVLLGRPSSGNETVATENPATKPAAASPDFRPAPVDMPPLMSMPNDVPVMGTAAGSHARGAFQFEGGVIDYVRRPPAMHGARNLYALYIEGTSMVPEHNPGDLRFVHPDRPARPGDSVIVQTRNGPHSSIEATMGRYVRQTPRFVVIGKLAPEATIEINRDIVVAVHKVLTVNDLFGV